MKDRSIRLQAILRLLRQNRVESQEALLELLEKEGFTLTQATLSRDLKLLKVGKIADPEYGYRYALPGDIDPHAGSDGYVEDITRGFLGIEFSQNLAVVHTVTGHADTVAIAMDNIGLPAVLGTVAGDDTVIVVLREDVDRQTFMDNLHARVPGISV